MQSNSLCIITPYYTSFTAKDTLHLFHKEFCIPSLSNIQLGKRIGTS